MRAPSEYSDIPSVFLVIIGLMSAAPVHANNMTSTAATSQDVKSEATVQQSSTTTPYNPSNPPTIDGKSVESLQTIYRGGTRVTVAGTNFRPTGNPRIEITSFTKTGDVVDSLRSKTGPCKVESQQKMVCITPDVSENIPDIVKSYLENKNIEDQTEYNLLGVLFMFRLGFLFADNDEYMFINETVPGWPIVVALKTPTPDGFSDPQQFMKDISIYGRFYTVVNRSEIKLYVGADECELGGILQNVLFCRPIDIIPRLKGTEYTEADLVQNMTMRVGENVVHYIGELVFTMPPDYTSYYIIGGGAGGGLILIIIIIIIIVCVCKRRKSSSGDPEAKEELTKIVTETKPTEEIKKPLPREASAVSLTEKKQESIKTTTFKPENQDEPGKGGNVYTQVNPKKKSSKKKEKKESAQKPVRKAPAPPTNGAVAPGKVTKEAETPNKEDQPTQDGKKDEKPPKGKPTIMAPKPEKKPKPNKADARPAVTTEKVPVTAATPIPDVKPVVTDTKQETTEPPSPEGLYMNYNEPMAQDTSPEPNNDTTTGTHPNNNRMSEDMYVNNSFAKDYFKSNPSGQSSAGSQNAAYQEGGADEQENLYANSEAFSLGGRNPRQSEPLYGNV